MQIHGERQYDIPLTPQYHYAIPTSVPGRITSQDFVYFNIPSGLDVSKYIVAMESYSGGFLKVGQLTPDYNGVSTVKLPHVHIPYDSLIVLLPNDPSLPKYAGTAQRGKTYQVSQCNNPKHGFYVMR